MSDKGRIAQLTARLDRVGEIKKAAGVYAETKVQELAERKLRFDKLELGRQRDISVAGNAWQRYRQSRALRTLARTLRSLTLSRTADEE